jgi:hypothetical protein
MLNAESFLSVASPVDAVEQPETILSGVVYALVDRTDASLSRSKSGQVNLDFDLVYSEQLWREPFLRGKTIIVSQRNL